MLFIAVNALPAQYDKDLLYKNISEKYKNPKSLILKFKLKEMNVNGTIHAAAGNKYILDLSDRIIVSNGETIWNYDKFKNSVMISTFESLSSASLEKFFFEILVKYYPVKVSKENSSNKRPAYLMLLEPAKPSDAIEGVKQIKLWASVKSLDIVSLAIISNSQTQTFDIEKIEINPKSLPSFSFTAPKDAKIIDLR